MRVGVHCSIRKGFIGAIDEAVALGCETLQIFTQSPRGWKTRIYEDAEFDSFRARLKETGLSPVVVHSPYLPNLCTSDPHLYAKSISTLKEDLERCEKLGARFLVIHPGAYSPTSDYETGIKQLIAAINESLAEVPGTIKILIENMAGGGRRIGARFSEIADILKGVTDRSRVGVCFDTCHALGAGYDVSNPKGVDEMLNEFESLVGLREIQVFHVNDSKGNRGSNRDIHQHLGKGFVGLDGLRKLFRSDAFRDCALILETPKESPHSDTQNLKILRSLLPAYTPV